jgi:DNA-binding IclR family transcriptional regulator
MAKRQGLDPGSIDAEILVFLSRRERARAVDVARGTGLNPKSVWQALQRLVRLGYVNKDEFDIYSITEVGLQEVQDLKADRLRRVKFFTARLARHVDELSEEEVRILETLETKVKYKLEKSK